MLSRQFNQVTVVVGKRRRVYGSMADAVRAFRFRVIGRRALVLLLRELFFVE
jgi:hypothetical protein